jgi:NAD(P)-dependent dehydrogenase (short-subunit alcohol dehydrogenase family)
MTSEGNQLAWKGYAAVAAAKVALESVARAMAVELAPYGIRANVAGWRH